MSKSKNKETRMKLEQIYGKGCFFARAKLAERLEERDITLSFKKFVQEKRYKGKKIRNNITYHHLRHVSERW